MRNHINIIPRFGMTYNKLEPENFDSVDTTTIEPGITLSFAFNNRISVNGNYTYVRDVDFGKHLDAHTYGGGARIALTETLGIDVGARFADGEDSPAHSQGFRSTSESLKIFRCGERQIDRSLFYSPTVRLLRSLVNPRS
jgi:hypothetical protein